MKRAAPAEAILLNSSGGVAAGDVLRTRLALGANARATVTTQAAERYYRALDIAAPARVDTALALDAHADFAWLPQETILFDGCAMRRQLTVEMAGSARFLGIEALTFGRRASNEDVRTGLIADTIRITRDGALLWRDRTRLAGRIGDVLDRAAVASGARAMATLIYVAADAAERLDAVRQALALPARDGGWLEAGASAWNGMLVARLLGVDAMPVRAALVAAAGLLAGTRPWPRAWAS